MTELLLGPVPGSWSVDALPEAVPGQAWVAATSHNKSFLALWAVDRQRQARLLGRYPEVGFHPDNLHWVKPVPGEHPVLLVAAEGLSQIQRWKGVESGDGLAMEASLRVSDPPRDLVMGDLDADGVPDLVVGPYEASRIGVLWGQGDFKFEVTWVPAAAEPNHPRIGDWDGDGRPDILWGNCLGEQVMVALNRGERRWEIKQLWGSHVYGCPRQIALVDVDGDGRLDLVAPLEGGGKALVLYNDGQGKVAKIDEIPSPSVGYRWVAARPGPDPLLAFALPADGVVLARREGDAWRLRQLPTGSMPTMPVLQDLDGDAEVDLLVAQAPEEVLIRFGPLWERATELGQ